LSKAGVPFSAAVILRVILDINAHPMVDLLRQAAETGGCRGWQ